MHPGHRLDLVTDLLVAGQVAGPVAILDTELAGGLAFGGEILGLAAMIHHLGSQKGDLAPNAFIGHVRRCADFSPSRRRWAKWVEERPEPRIGPVPGPGSGVSVKHSLNHSPSDRSGQDEPKST